MNNNITDRNKRLIELIQEWLEDESGWDDDKLAGDLVRLVFEDDNDIIGSQLETLQMHGADIDL